MNYAIIAAGEGSRLAQEGVAKPKPLVELQGEPMIGRLINIMLRCNAESISIIVNEHMTEVREYLESLELQKQLTQNISHELKTPLSGIRAYLETLHLHPEMPEETRTQFIERSCALARRLADLTEDLNTLDAAERVVLREELNVADILLQVLQDTEEDFRERQMSLETNFPESIPLTGDRKLLYSLFRNLVDNSLRYAGEGSTVSVRARKEGKNWLFSFSDNGPGVPEESLPHLYERFFRTDKGRSRELGGTGLGLSIVREAVRLHGGDIQAHAVSPHGLQHSFMLS